MASQLWGGGGGPPANAVVKLLPDATAEVLVGVQDIGTGTRTALTQIAAEELGLPLSSVRVVLGDTLPTPYGPTSSGSQTLPSAGPAVRAAARDALLQLFELAAELPEGEGTELEELYVKDGEIRSRVKPQLRIPLTQVAETMGNYTIVGEGGRGPNPDGVSINTFGAQFAGVDVNPETGQVRVRALYAVHDVGRVVNPLTATNQVYGGVVQGTGFGLTEKRVLDPQTGQQLTRGLEEYKLPTVVDAPPRVDVTFVDRADAEANSVGARGLGEPPIIPTTAAIANAVSDALGARVTEIPMTPKVILDLLRGRKEVAP
jgi:xanthine dehydrogenase YagR molybdenum-binding subunit